ncbi:hypothetical protein [Streptomyces sindenensis]|uniref:Uncharacterized protein n=1 Tax=Streptomyces sindenensis TaxID=67363 RepID=A0ABW6EQL9_9ACTN
MESRELVIPTAVETAVERTGQPQGGEELQLLAPATAAALRLLADAIGRRDMDPDAVLDALKSAGVHDAFADVFDNASAVVTDAVEDPDDFDDRLHADNLSAAARSVRDAFRWL